MIYQPLLAPFVNMQLLLTLSHSHYFSPIRSEMFIAVQIAPVPTAKLARIPHLQPFNQRTGLGGMKFRADFFLCIIKRDHYKFTTLPSVLCVW